MKILVTGFEPFGADAENASAEAVLRLQRGWAGGPIAGVELITATLPVVFAEVEPALTALVALHEPNAVLAVGEAGGRRAITPERWAVNELDARIPDNAGAQPRGVPIDEAGPARRLAGVDVDALVAAARAVDLPAEVSDDAGRFLCNHLAYLVSGLPVPGGFVHVPAVRSSGVATVGAETDVIAAGAADPDASASAPGDAHHRDALTFDDLARGLAAMVDAVARGVATAASARQH